MLRFRRFFAPLVVATLALTACDDDVTGPQTANDVTFDPSLGVVLADMTDVGNGLYIQTLTPGTGVPASAGDAVVVDYTLWLPNGTEVQVGTFPFTLLPGQSIEGFRLGVLGMLPDETRLIVIPSALGYGAAGQNQIPPHSVLVYRVTLTELNPPV